MKNIFSRFVMFWRRQTMRCKLYRLMILYVVVVATILIIYRSTRTDHSEAQFLPAAEVPAAGKVPTKDQVELLSFGADASSKSERRKLDKKEVTSKLEQISAQTLASAFHSPLLKDDLDKQREEIDRDSGSTSPVLKDNVNYVDSNSNMENQQADETIPVLLLTYMRSGSSWLGDITKQASSSFYVFEPFQLLIKQGYYKNGSVCYDNNICREPRHETETSEFLIKTLHQIYTCDFVNINKRVLPNILRHQKKENKPVVSNRTASKLTEAERFFRNMTDRCLHAKYRIVKTIRLSMELMNPLMDAVRSLRVIHLVRDPRAITNSRLQAKFHMARQDDAHSRALCNRMYNDVILGDQFLREFPNTFTLVLYEALAEKPFEGAKYVFNFLNATYSEGVQMWVYTSSQKKAGGLFSTSRNSSTAATHWRNQLKFNTTVNIQQNCKNVFSRLGYIPFESPKTMQNYDLKARIAVNRSGFL